MLRYLVYLPFHSSTSVVNWFSNHWRLSGKINVKVGDNLSIKMYTKCDDVLVDSLYYNSFDEYAEVKILSAIARCSSVFFDIGANTGLYSLITSKVNPHIEVHAFEPYSTNFDRLRFNVKLNNLHNLILVQKAVGSSNGTVPFHVPLGGSRISQVSSMNKEFSESHRQNDIESFETINIDQITLDSYSEKNSINQIDILKIDVESNEYETLRGAVRTIKELRPIILCEVSNDLSEIHDLIIQFNYEVYSVLDDQLVEFSPVTQKKGRNLFFIPIEKKNNSIANFLSIEN